MYSLLTALREATKIQHERLHRHPLLIPLQERSITYDDYLWCIHAFYEAYTHMEKKLKYKLEHIDVPILAWLENDLAVHDISPIRINSFDYPLIDNMSKFFGYLYVKQGSLLGGRVISRHLSRTLGLVECETNHFFAGYGEGTGQYWKDFLHLLDTKKLTEEEVVTQAVQTFDMITACCNMFWKIRRVQSTGLMGIHAS